MTFLDRMEALLASFIFTQGSRLREQPPFETMHFLITMREAELVDACSSY